VERWASLPIEATYGQPLTLRVLGPSNFPKSFDAELVRQMPGLGVICALIHGPAPDAEEHYFDTLEAVAAAQRRDTLDEETASLYIDLVVQKASKMWRKLMEEKVTTGPYLSDLMNRLHDQATRKGLEEGLEKGLEKGLEEGRERGLKDAIRQVFSGRGLEWTTEYEAQLESCHDADLLGLWLGRSSTALASTEVFQPTD
jgi:hypothetical protein